MISAQQELERFLDRRATIFKDALLNLAKAQLGTFDYGRAIEDLAKLLQRTMILSNMHGRRRVFMEADHAVRRSKFAQIPDSTPIVPQVPFEEAIEDLLTREPRLERSSKLIALMYSNEHVFAAAKSIDLEMTKRVQKAIADLTRQGTTKIEASEVIQEITGWTRAYADTVYRTNVCSSYSAGRFEQAKDPDVQEVVPAMEYVAIMDAETRPNHAAFHGLVAASDDPIWKVATPPEGFNCRCSTVMVSKYELERRHLLRNGKVVRSLPSGFNQAHPDKGFKVGGWIQ